MDGVGEVQRGCAPAQRNGVSFWGENVYLVPEQLHFHSFGWSATIRFRRPVNDLPNQFKLLVVVFGFFGSLVPPVGSNPVFGEIVHFFRADLDLKGHTLPA